MLVAVKSELQASLCSDLQSEAEDVWISLRNSNGNKMFICCVYIPPGDNNAYLLFIKNLQSRTYFF